jgi:hypothetical protein
MQSVEDTHENSRGFAGGGCNRGATACHNAPGHECRSSITHRGNSGEICNAHVGRLFLRHRIASASYEKASKICSVTSKTCSVRSTRAGMPAWHAVACFVVGIVSLSIPLAWLRLRSGSFWPRPSCTRRTICSCRGANATTKTRRREELQATKTRNARNAAAEAAVWAIDAARLRNYLVPRECPRVTEVRIVRSLWPLHDAVVTSDPAVFHDPDAQRAAEVLR